jgi:hypothetical protein
MLRLRISFVALAALVLCACISSAHERPDETRFGSYTGKDARNVERTFASTETGGVHTPWQVPGRVSNQTYWVDADSNADVTSSALDCGGASVAWFTFVMTNGSTPVGAFSVQGSYDGTNQWTGLYLDANRVHGANFTNAGAYPGGYTVAVSSPAGTVVIVVAIEHPPPYLRLFYDRTSGGAVDTIDAFSFIRG